MMKSITVIAIGLCILIGASLVKADDVNGIYAIDGDINQLVSVHKKGDNIVAVALNNYVSLFDILIGTKKNGYMHTIYGHSVVNGSYKIIEITKDYFIVEQEYCEPRYGDTPCTHENGYVLHGERLF